MYTRLEEINFIQIDHTTKCNLQCLQCARTANGKLNTDMPLNQELQLTDYEHIFDDWFFNKAKKLNRFLFSGNYGDAIAGSNIIEVILFLKAKGLKAIHIATNGSLQSVSWWKELAKVLNRPQDKVIFSIDGLADTNHLYRVNSNFEKIIANATEFISAGGRARWDYLVFEHNHHQLNEAKELAKRIGFQEFATKKTNRFNNDSNYNKSKGSVSEKTISKNGEFELSAPISDEKNLATGTKNFDQIIAIYGTWNKYLESTKISCQYQKWGGGLFVDFETRLWPCTWLASPIYHYGAENGQKKQIQKLFSRYGDRFNVIKDSNFETVLNHQWFQNDLTDSWSQKLESENFRLKTCGRTCGELYDFSSASQNNRIIESLK